eukprot:scaffold547042_cov20-Prasinocladus_malaysianus.AAC.1
MAIGLLAHRTAGCSIQLVLSTRTVVAILLLPSLVRMMYRSLRNCKVGVRGPAARRTVDTVALAPGLAVRRPDSSRPRSRARHPCPKQINS